MVKLVLFTDVLRIEKNFYRDLSTQLKIESIFISNLQIIILTN